MDQNVENNEAGGFRSLFNFGSEKKIPKSPSKEKLSNNSPLKPNNNNNNNTGTKTNSFNHNIINNSNEYTLISKSQTSLPIVDYLEDLVIQRKKVEEGIKLFTETSKFSKLIQAFIDERQKELTDVEPSFYKHVWKIRKAELLFLQEELKECEASESKDESRLLETCQRIAVQKDADKRLKAILEKVYKGEININRVYNYQTLLREYEIEKKLLKEENETLRQENKQLNEKIEKQQEQLEKRKKEAKNLKEQFGGVIIREIANKEKELREEFSEREKELKEEYLKNLNIELAKKDEKQAQLQEEIDSLKLKNVQWVIEQANFAEKIDKLEKENQKLQKCYRNVQQEFIKLQNNHTQIEYEYTHLKKEYNELYMKYRNMSTAMHITADNIINPDEIDQKFQQFLNEKKQEKMQKFKTIASLPKDKETPHVRFDIKEA